MASACRPRIVTDSDVEESGPKAACAVSGACGARIVLQMGQSADLFGPDRNPILDVNCWPFKFAFSQRMSIDFHSSFLPAGRNPFQALCLNFPTPWRRLGAPTFLPGCHAAAPGSGSNLARCTV